MKENPLFTLLLFLVVFFLSSCSKIYYVGETSEPLLLYSSPDVTTTSLFTVPISNKVLVKQYGSYYYVIYQSYHGYSYKPLFINYHRFNSANDGILYGYSSNKKKYNLANSYSSPSTFRSTYTGGTVHVNGYYRKNGTYVRPYTRSAPHRH